MERQRAAGDGRLHGGEGPRDPALPTPGPRVCLQAGAQPRGCEGPVWCCTSAARAPGGCGGILDGVSLAPHHSGTSQLRPPPRYISPHAREVPALGAVGSPAGTSLTRPVPIPELPTPVGSPNIVFISIFRSEKTLRAVHPASDGSNPWLFRGLWVADACFWDFLFLFHYEFLCVDTRPSGLRL